jgi:hypothetical protein
MTSRFTIGGTLNTPFTVIYIAFFRVRVQKIVSLTLIFV